MPEAVEAYQKTVSALSGFWAEGPSAALELGPEFIMRHTEQLLEAMVKLKEGPSKKLQVEPTWMAWESYQRLTCITKSESVISVRDQYLGRRAAAVLERLFTSRVRVGLIAFFVMNPDQRRHIRALAKVVRANYSAVWKELRNLGAAGLVLSEEEAGRRFFSLSPDYPLIQELRGIVVKTVGAGDTVRKALQGIGGVQAAFIYGSFADGRVDAQSDIDLMVIGESRLEQLSPTIARLEQALGRSINVVSYTSHEWKTRLQEKEPFVLEVLSRPKLMLVGSEDAL